MTNFNWVVTAGIPAIFLRLHANYVAEPELEPRTSCFQNLSYSYGNANLIKSFVCSFEKETFPRIDIVATRKELYLIKDGIADSMVNTFT